MTVPIGTGSVARILGRIGAGALAAALVVTLAGVGQPPAGPGPGRGPRGDRPGADQPSAPEKPGPKSIPVPEAMKKAGTVYQAIAGKDRQVAFHSDAPVEKIDGQSNGVIGYAVAGGADSPATLKGGEWRLPVASLRTGNRTKDGHLRGGAWLDAAASPDIIFKLKEVKDAKVSKEEKDKGFTTYTATLVGDMTIHGVARPMTIDGATMTFMKASAETAKTAKGDLMALRAKYDVKLSDHGVSNPAIGQKVADSISIDMTLYMSTVAPEDQG